jgi:hypothetical protein
MRTPQKTCGAAYEAASCTRCQQDSAVNWLFANDNLGRVLDAAIAHAREDMRAELMSAPAAAAGRV